MPPEFPLRILFDDGAVEIIDSPEELMQLVDSIDSGDPAARTWVRDAYDRSVVLRMRHGIVEAFTLA